MNKTNIKSHLLVFIATVLVAGSFLASKDLAGIINPFSLTLLRFLGAALLLTPIVIQKKVWRQQIIPTMPRAMIIGLFYSAFFIGFFESLKTTTSLNTSALFTLTPLTTALLAVFLIKDTINLRKIFVYFFGALGAIWVIFNGELELLLSFSLNKGDFIFLLAVLSMSCYSISMKQLYREDQMIVLVFCTLISGSLWMTLALILFNQEFQWNLLQGNSMFQMAYLILGATLGTMYLYQKTTVILGPSAVNAYVFLNPALVALLLFLKDNSPISTAIIPGILLSCFATVILQYLDYKDKQEREP